MVRAIFTQIVYKKLEGDVRNELPNHSLSRLGQFHSSVTRFGDKESD